jgi:prespore-specific regulator
MERTVRSDAWTEEQDHLLAEVILRYIREGSSQLAAFEELSERIGRTASAIGFRWNATVRHDYKAAIDIAKKQRIQLKADRRGKRQRTSSRVTSITSPIQQQEKDSSLANDSIQFSDVINFLKDQNRKMKELSILNQELSLENKHVKSENDKLKKENRSVQTISDDYKDLLKILDRARRLEFLVEETDKEPSRSKFKMDSNGNLEKIG